jgi:DNA (cytosine-5)-methyltransferase 1
MPKLRSGELCAGYGGLARAIEQVFGATTAWFSEFDPAPSKILAYRYPTVPNYGDMTKIDWAAIEPVDVIGGGTPCQDLSTAGARRGMTEGTRSNLWVNMREAIAVQKPKFVVWENVRGAYSAEATSSVEQCPGCLGDTGDGRVVLRALGRVLGDLSDLGYDAEWRGLRAADVGACHARYRVFVLAYDPRRVGRAEALEHYGRSTAAINRAGFPDESDRIALRSRPLREATAHGNDVRIDGAGEWSEQDGRGQPSNGSVAAADADGRYDDGRFAFEKREAIERIAAAWSGEGDSQHVDWGVYESAVRRQESAMGRRAPAPTEPTGKNGEQQLSARFCEWMMWQPDGWITDPAIGISRNDQLKACGNGVVTQQAVSALRDMLGAIAARQAALMAAA